MSDLVTQLRNAQEEYQHAYLLSQLFEDAAARIERLEGEVAATCRCGANAWCPCLEHTVDGCPGTPIDFDGMKPVHVDDEG